MLGQTLIKKEMGERLKKARLNAGYSNVNDFCIQYDIPLTIYEQHENGVRAIKVSNAQHYCHLFNISLNWLLLGSKDKI